MCLPTAYAHSMGGQSCMAELGHAGCLKAGAPGEGLLAVQQLSRLIRADLRGSCACLSQACS